MLGGELCLGSWCGGIKYIIMEGNEETAYSHLDGVSRPEAGLDSKISSPIPQ